jgi:branched-chain amino acid transport system permease protein
MTTTVNTGSRTPTAQAAEPARSRSRPLRGRPAMFTTYAQELSLLNSRPKRLWVGLIVVGALVLPLALTDDWLRLLAVGYVAAIGAIGLNMVTGYAGQVTLGHAFFLGVGAYTAAVISGDPDGRTLGFGITSIPVWLLAGGAVAGLCGLLVAPLAVRLRGLYLAIVTLGLVFLGEHIFKEWDAVTGGPGVGRPAAVPQLLGYRLDQDGPLLTGVQQMYLLMLALLVVFAVAARNLMRSGIGRAFAAVRDRDIAAEIMGVGLTKHKALAFVVSSFYAGCSGALLYTVSGFFDPGSFNLMLSVQFIAMVLIGGVATISGSIMGALFIILLPRLTQELPSFVPALSTSPTQFPNVFQVESLLYGLLIIVFLIVEPRGLHGIWVRIRNYWASWPFTY